MQKLLIQLYRMYTQGELASEFDKKSNKMINSKKLDDLMLEVKKHIPEELTPLEAAGKMRQLKEAQVTEAVNSSDSVIDLRKQFQRKMSANGGALGLAKKLVKATEDNDIAGALEATMLMVELINEEAKIDSV